MKQVVAFGRVLAAQQIRSERGGAGFGGGRADV